MIVIDFNINFQAAAAVAAETQTGHSSQSAPEAPKDRNVGRVELLDFKYWRGGNHLHQSCAHSGDQEEGRGACTGQ